jgi:3-oxoacyl-ACP reductase-like protein
VKSLLLISASMLVASAPAAAQVTDAAPAVAAAAPAAAPQCELHIWPAERFQAMTSGWGAAFGVIGAIADSAGHAEGDKARRSHLASALDSEGQLDALQKLDLVGLLRLPPSKIVTHAEALDRKTVNKIKTRRSDSMAPCYAELMVMDVFYQKAAVWGRSLRTGFMLREFTPGAKEPSIRKTTGGNGLKIFPAKAGEDTTAADAELVAVFQKNFTEAAGNFAKQAVR